MTNMAIKVFVMIGNAKNACFLAIAKNHTYKKIYILWDWHSKIRVFHSNCQTRYLRKKYVRHDWHSKIRVFLNNCQVLCLPQKYLS